MKHGIGAPVFGKYSVFNMMMSSGPKSQINQPIRQIKKVKKPLGSVNKSNFTTNSNLSVGSFFQMANM
jgi:hypothetical protein